MKRLHGTVAVLGMLLVFLSSVALPIDDPETPYNESDAPITVASPDALNTVRATQLFEVSGTIAVFRGQRVGRDDDAIARNQARTRDTPSKSPSQFLSTLRC